MGIAMHSASMLRAIVIFFHFSAQRISGEYILIKNIETGLELSRGIFPLRRKYIRTGTRVMAITGGPEHGERSW